MRNNTTQVMWINPRASLTIVAKESRQLGRCYHGTTYEVSSTKEISPATLYQLFLLGFFGAGQEFKVVSSEEHKDSIAPCVVDLTTNKMIEGAVATNQYSGKPYEPMNMSYWVYQVERRTDSGD